MKITKIIEEGVPKLRIDREDGSEPQAFTKAQILEIKANTAAHRSRILATKAPGDSEYDFFITGLEGAGPLADVALDELDDYVADCDQLGVA